MEVSGQRVPSKQAWFVDVSLVLLFKGDRFAQLWNMNFLWWTLAGVYGQYYLFYFEHWTESEGVRVLFYYLSLIIKAFWMIGEQAFFSLFFHCVRRRYTSCRLVHTRLLVYDQFVRVRQDPKGVRKKKKKKSFLWKPFLWVLVDFFCVV